MYRTSHTSVENDIRNTNASHPSKGFPISHARHNNTMSVTRQDSTTTTRPESTQSVGPNPKRNSGLFAFFKWFRAPSPPPVEDLGEDLEDARPQVQARPDLLNASTSSSSSTDSLSSTGTVASFAYVPPSAYRPYGVANPPEKCIVPGPVTDTYRARLHQRDKRRESDKDLTLRKKYNLFFNRDTIRLQKSASSSNCKPPVLLAREHEEEEVQRVPLEDTCKSLPLMTRRTMQSDAEDSEEQSLRGAKNHRRANSESSKLRKAGAFCHVKGKRRAPQPPGGASSAKSDNGTMSLRRKKRLAPQPPAVAIAAATSRILNTLEHVQANRYGTIEYADADVLYNDSLKLDNGFLKPVKETEEAHTRKETVGATTSSKRASASTDPAPVSPRPWYKRTLGGGGNRDSGSNWKANIPVAKNSGKYHNDDYEPIDTFPDVRSSKHELNFLDGGAAKTKKVEEKRKSGLSFLTNISELDREAAEIVKQGKSGGAEDVFPEEDDTDLPPFMRPRAEHMRINSDSWISPKRRSARDLIAKFNAITNVTKVTVNSAFFSSSSSSSSAVTAAASTPASKDSSQAKREYFSKKCRQVHSVDETAMEQKAKAISKYFDPPAKKQISNAATPPPDKQKSEPPPTAPATPKLDRKSWYCPKCSADNDYWRIICHVCSTIKPYFDDLTTPPVAKNNSLEKTTKRTTPELNPNNTPSVSNVSVMSSDKLKTVNDEELFERVLQRSKTQIGFPTKSNVFEGAKKKPEKSAQAQDDRNKKEEREKLKKMLIEMKNSLPKRKLSNGKPANAANRASIIQEDPQVVPKEPPAEQTAEITLVTTETIYENVRMRRTENPKPLKVSSSAQTNAAVFKPIPNLGIVPGGSSATKSEKTFELIRAKDFLGMSEDKTHIYANLDADGSASGPGGVSERAEKSPGLFLNMPKVLEDEKDRAVGNTDTLEINRLLRRLESAIAKGELGEASVLARDLAQLKVNCSVVRQKSVEKNESGAAGFT